TDAQEPGGTLSIVDKQTVDIGAEHAPVRRAGTFIRSSGKPCERPRAVRTVGKAHMHLIAFERRSVGRRTESRREPLVAGEYSLDVEQSETIDLARRTFEALRIGDGAAKHLVTTAHSEQPSASPHMCPDVDLQPAGAQDLEIGDRRLGTGKNHQIGVPRQSRIGSDVYQLHGGFCGQGIKVIKVGDAWKDGNSDSDFRVASAAR